MKQSSNGRNGGYYRLYKALLSPSTYPGLSLRAAVMVAVLNDRAGLSALHADMWTDSNGDIYLYYTIDAGCRLLGCSHDTMTAVFRELEHHKLIRREHQGQGRPCRIYVLPIRSEPADESDARLRLNSSSECDALASNNFE